MRGGGEWDELERGDEEGMGSGAGDEVGMGGWGGGGDGGGII